MIPYSTAAEAEAALGRALSPAEAVWFCYSAAMPDCLLLWHNTLILFLVLTLAPLPLLLLERLAPSFAMRYKLQPQARRLSQQADVGRYFWDRAGVFTLVMVSFQILSYPVVKMAGTRMGLPLPSAWETAVQLLVYTLVEDYLSYWIHRLLHTGWAYGRIHHVHHEVTAPTGFAALYSHWAELVAFAIPVFVGPTIAPCHVTTHWRLVRLIVSGWGWSLKQLGGGQAQALGPSRQPPFPSQCLLVSSESNTPWIWFAINLLEAIDTHSGYNFPFQPTKLIPFYGGAEFHDYHHYVGGQSKSNFGFVFTYCDYIYGTNKGYKYHKANMAKMKEKLAKVTIHRKEA
ncbi:unnamed protein product [Urochloa humidicola]